MSLNYQRLILVFANLLVAACAIGMANAVDASELVYVPMNPSFGGSPLNGTVLLNTAQATNKHKDPSLSSSSPFSRTPLQQFNEMLERSILSQLSYAATSNIMGSNGKLIPGTVDTGNFRIHIADLGGGLLLVTTTDKTTGATTSFQVSQGGPL